MTGNKVIHKFAVHPDRQEIFAPRNAEILSVGMQDGEIIVWMTVNPQEPFLYHRVYVVGTGREVPSHCKFVGTVFDGPFVWHIFK